MYAEYGSQKPGLVILNLITSLVDAELNEVGLNLVNLIELGYPTGLILLYFN